MTFDGRCSPVAIVTGGSRGIGRAIAERLRDEGFEVVSFSKSSVVKDHCYRCDITDQMQVEEAVSGVIKRFGRVDVLVNNAGIVTSDRLVNTSLEDWRLVIATNLTAAFLLSKSVIPSMSAQGSGSIINISSIAARNYSPTASAAYTASKAGLVGFTRQLAQELVRLNIRVNCVCPSQTRTEMLERNLSDSQIHNIEKHVPMSRLAEPTEIAEVVNFLASKKASYVTGAVVDVNGGQI